MLFGHLERTGSRCRVLTGPGVIPRLRSKHNMLVPDLAITCAPPSADRAANAPVVLIEILSPSNFRRTRANIWAFATIPTVREMLVVDSRKIAAELMRRQDDGSWPERGERLGADAVVRLNSIGFETALRAVYRTTVLMDDPAPPSPP
jgi:Uma2 family endonuclease